MCFFPSQPYGPLYNLALSRSRKNSQSLVPGTLYKLVAEMTMYRLGHPEQQKTLGMGELVLFLEVQPQPHGWYVFKFLHVDTVRCIDVYSPTVAALRLQAVIAELCKLLEPAT